MHQIKKIAPPPALANYIDCYWTLKSDQKSEGLDFTFQHMLPEGIVEIIFEFSGNFKQQFAEKAWHNRPKSFVGGLFDKKYSIQNSKEINLLSIRFFSATARHFFDKPISNFRSETISIADVFGIKGKDLEEQLHAASPSERIHILNTFLQKQLEANYKTQGFVDVAVQTIVHSKGTVNIQSLSNNLNVSERHFRRTFKEQVGLSPKLFSRVIRINQFLKQEKDFRNLTEAAYNFGYFDQAHFVHEFSQFTGVSPSKHIQFHEQLQFQLNR